MRYVFILLIFLAACRDETSSAYAPSVQDYFLVAFNAQPIKYTATLRFGENGTITGRAPCNSFAGRSGVPYPWFEFTLTALSKMTCEQIVAEQTYLAQLRRMQLAEFSGDTLILGNDAGEEMVFRRR